MAARLSSTLLRTQTDRRLVTMAAQGSEPAFEALVERYRRPLQAYCRRMLLPAEAAEDVVQQAFLSTWQALQRDTGVQDAKAWLYRVTHNAALNALKRSGYDHDQLDEALHGAGAPEDDLERRIAVRQTLAGLAELPELQREALLRTAVEGQSHEDVARALGLTDGAVRGLVYRARATLRTAATALTPAPVAQWAAAAGGAPNAPLAERIAELVAGGGTAGATALLVKGSATLVAAGTLAGGAVVVDKEVRERPRDDDRVEQRVAAPEVAGLAPSPGRDATEAARRGRSELASLSAGEHGSDRGARDDDRSGPGGSLPGSRDDGHKDDRSGPRGPDVREEHDDDRAGRGPGPGDPRPDSSGPGGSESGDEPRPDSSGPGGSESGDEPRPDLSGPGGSESGDEPRPDSSGAGGSESGDEPRPELSGSGSGGDDPSRHSSGEGGSGSGDDPPVTPALPDEDDEPLPEPDAD